MIRILRTDSGNEQFIELVASLDAELAERDGRDHAFYDQFNKIYAIKYAIVLTDGLVNCGCGAIKEYDQGTMEVKRMYVVPEKRGQGLASAVLMELESWARELNYKRCILETGKRQPEAIRLYEYRGYERIPNYGQYANIDNSLCFEKWL